MAKKILSVDDDPHMQMLLEYNFNKAGYRFFKARNGHLALKIVKENKPDLIITDIDMPELNGIELCQKLKKDPDTGHIPIIILSCKTQIQEISNDTKLGANAYFSKPFHPEELLKRVRTLIGSEVSAN